MKVGFIGLGRMGRGMALNLARANVDLTVFDLAPAARDLLQDAGAKIASSVREITSEVDVLFTSLPGPKEVEEVILGSDGVLEALKPGLVVFDLSTSSLALARRIQTALAERGASFLDAPVSGGPAGAASGDMAIWVGGEKQVFGQHFDLLKIMGDKTHYVGDLGAGIVAKLAHNMTGYMLLLAMAESFSLAVKAGVEPLSLWKTLKLGVVGKAPALDMLVKQFLPGKYEEPAFALKLAHKDVRLATEMARELGVPMRLAEMTMADMTEALTEGWGDQDSRAYLKLQLRRAGVQIKVEQAEIDEALGQKC